MEKLIVKNFKAIEYAEIEVNDLTFFIGQQASGKSTLAKLVYFFKTLGKYMTDEILVGNFRKNNLFHDINNFCYAQFYSLFSESSILEHNFFDIYYEYNKEKQFHFTNNNNNLFININSKLSDSLKIKVKEYNNFIDNTISVNNRQINLLAKQIENEVKNLFPYSLDSFYLPAGRSFFALANKQVFELGKDFKNQHNDYLRNYQKYSEFDIYNENALINYTFINLCADLKKIAPSFNSKENVLQKKQDFIINGNYSQIANEEFIELPNKIKVHLSNSSSGQQEVIRLLQDINYISIFEKNAFRVYEEPEAHLFPASQKALMEMIVILLNSNPNIQLLISTHTPYLLAVLNVLMKAKELEKQLGENDLTLNSLVPKEERLDVSRVRVYSAKQTENGRFIFENVVNQETQSINAEIIDEVSEEIEMTYDQLLDLQSNLSNSVSE